MKKALLFGFLGYFTGNIVVGALLHHFDVENQLRELRKREVWAKTRRMLTEEPVQEKSLLDWAKAQNLLTEED